MPRDKLEPIKPVTWNELADAYDAAHSGARLARTLRMESVFAWGERQTDKFILGSDDGLYWLPGARK
jgi:hypothetical protein